MGSQTAYHQLTAVKNRMQELEDETLACSQELDAALDAGAGADGAAAGAAGEAGGNRDLDPDAVQDLRKRLSGVRVACQQQEIKIEEVISQGRQHKNSIRLARKLLFSRIVALQASIQDLIDVVERSAWVPAKGDVVLRKGVECTVTHVDISLRPPGLTIRPLAGGDEISTEVSRVRRR